MRFSRRVRAMVAMLIMGSGGGACADDDAFRVMAQTRAAEGVDAAAQAGQSRDASRPMARGARAAAGTRARRDAGTRAPRDAGQPAEKKTSRMQEPPAQRAPRGTVALMDPMLDQDAGLDDADGGPADAARQPPPQDCTGKPGAPGTTTRMYRDRAYIVHIPPDASANAALPVMFVFHGAGGTGEQMQMATGFDALADQVGLVTVYPNGEMGNAPWNVGRNVCPPGNFVSTTQDDIAYVEHMLEDVAKDQCIDRDRVFATGFSMGGYFANELGCRAGRSIFRAIAPHSGGAHRGACPGAPLPVLILHGDSDSLINYRCGTQARDYWVERNGCSAEIDRLEITGGYCDYNRDCPEQAPVVMCTFEGLDHAWAYPPMYENSGLLIWIFFSLFM